MKDMKYSKAFKPSKPLVSFKEKKPRIRSIINKIKNVTQNKSFISTFNAPIPKDIGVGDFDLFDLNY